MPFQVLKYDDSFFDQVIAHYKNSELYGGHFDESRDTAERLKATSDIGNMFIVKDAGKMIGSCMILDNPHSFWILRFTLDPTHEQSNKAGNMLVDKVIDIAKKRGHKSIIVYTDRGSEELNSRYKQLGFIKANSYRCYWKGV